MPHNNASHCSSQRTSGILLAHLLEAARRQARQSGLAPDCVEDCAIEFAETLLLHKRDRLLRAQHNRNFDAWLRRCARNHVANFIEYNTRRWNCEQPWPQEAEQESAPWQQLLRGMNPAPPPEQGVFSAELRTRVMQASEGLGLEARRMFVAHYLHDASLGELAAAHNRTLDAVGKVLKRACLRVRVALHRQGVSEADLAEYVALILTRNGQG